MSIIIVKHIHISLSTFHYFFCLRFPYNLCSPRSGEFTGPVEFDLGNLTVYEPRGPPPAELAADETAACLAHGRDVLQKLVARTRAVPRPPVSTTGCAKPLTTATRTSAE